MKRLNLVRTVVALHNYPGECGEAWNSFNSNVLVAKVAGGTVTIAPAPEPATILPLVCELAELDVSGWRRPPWD
jgi:hypothetical protein